ncbi:54S ribosomal protein L4 mitochondrial [Dipsacomyces acuminosporus]|nr:54S ribosomal protein L4 mitochondrial [Dipsacomyces acuminosporus]
MNRMFGQLGSISRQLTTKRVSQSGFIGRGLEEFFEKGQRLPKNREQTGRAWSASELRQKSWEDLQKLWYIILKERNVLASQVEETKRLGIPGQFFSNKSRIIKCKKSMARIKTVLNERRIAWEVANSVTEASQDAAIAAAPKASVAKAGKAAEATAAARTSEATTATAA